MSLATMAKELNLSIADYAYALAKTHLAEALSLIEDEQLWSFQLIEGGWLAPGLLGSGSGSLLSPGTITVSPYSNQIVGDATASAAWSANLITRPLLTEQQIRIPQYSLYNIIAATVNESTGIVTLTIDRPWMEPSQTLASYMLYQAYFPAPGTGAQMTGWAFKKFYDVRDTTNNAPMNFWYYDRARLGICDSQRTEFGQPAYVVPYMVDQRPGSATLGQMLFELWPHPLSQWPYTFSCLSKGPALVNPTDTVPYPLTEDLLKWRAKSVAYQFKEAQKGQDIQRGTGANWLLLAEKADAEYERRLKQIKLADQGQVDLYFSKLRRGIVPSGPFATITGQLNVGTFEGE